LFTAMPTPYAVVSEFSLPYGRRGTHFIRNYRIERNGFEGPLTVRTAEKQMRHLQGVQGTTVEVPAGVDEFDYTVYLPPYMEMSRTSRTVVTAYGEVIDEQGKRHKVSFTSVRPSEQISLIIGPGPLSCAVEPAAVVAAAEQPAEIRVRIDRDAQTQGPVRVEVVVPSHIRGIESETIEVPAGETQGAMRLRFASDAGPLNMPLTVRAVHGEGTQQVVAEASLEIVSD